jgi:hypothetical protein
MRKLLRSLSLAAVVGFVAAPAFAQDKPLPPADQPAQQDKNKDLPKKDLDKDGLPDSKPPIPRDDQKDLPPLPKPPLPDRKQDTPNPNLPGTNERPQQPAQPGGQQQPPAQGQPQQQPGTGAKAGVQGGANVQTQRVTGKIVKADNGQVVLLTDAGKEVTLNSAAQTRFMIDGQPARFADLNVGTVVNAAYFMDRERMVLDTITVGGTAPAAPAEGTLLQGTVVKVVGQDQIVVRTADGKEMVVFVSPQTKFQLTTQGGAIADVTPNLPVVLNYDIIDRRPVVRTIRPWRR